ncbi:hypothetical protein FACHB389_30165 [Nostoc calcicola FACHB-389]|nr:hypothetical protein [Nostoc calcicola FACHB-3891]OKH23878.1 hypothetical protein FACHB389_30165 [Nostoc calcicola FACHB-389]
MKAPYSQGTTVLQSPCPSCQYQRGLVIIRFKDDLGFVRCGRCDAPLYSVSEVSNQQTEEVAA